MVKRKRGEEEEEKNIHIEKRRKKSEKDDELAFVQTRSLAHIRIHSYSTRFFFVQLFNEMRDERATGIEERKNISPPALSLSLYRFLTLAQMSSLSFEKTRISTNEIH